MNVNNGQLVDVEMPGFKGQAGFVNRDGHDEIAFPASLESLRVNTGDAIKVGDQGRFVQAVAASPFLRGFVVLELVK